MDVDAAIRLLKRQKEQAEQLHQRPDILEAEIQVWKAVTRDALTKIFPPESARHYLPCLSNWQTVAYDSDTDENVRLSDQRNGLKRAIATLSECIEVFRLEHSDAQSPAAGVPDMDAIGVLSKKQYEIDLPRMTSESTKAELPLGLLIIDIDDFKKVNDQVTHQGGDEVLKLLAKKLRESVQGKGSVYRFGGDEFVVLLPNHSIEEAAAFARRLFVEVPKLTYPKNIAVTVTMGVSAWPIPVPDINNLFDVADNLLLDAKKKGRKNNIHVASIEPRDIIGANEWRLTLILSPETIVAIPKHLLADYLINSCYSLPVNDFGRRYRFPLFTNRSNFIDERILGRVGAKVDLHVDAEGTYQISQDGSAKLIIRQRYAQSIHAIQDDVVLKGTAFFWPFVTRFWKQLPPQTHFLHVRLDGIAGAYLSLDLSLYREAMNLVAKSHDYQSEAVLLQPASGKEGLIELLLQTFQIIVDAFSPPQGVSKNDFRGPYFQAKSEIFLDSVRDPDPQDE